jgi:uncharacterized protein (TIGR00661 family)
VYLQATFYPTDFLLTLGQPQPFPPDFPKTPHPDKDIAINKNNKIDIWFTLFILYILLENNIFQIENTIISVLKKDRLRVLIAPLDWGLGHTTRCIPIIKHLLENNCSVIIGTEGAPKKLLELEFPQVQFLPLQGYRMNYSKSKRLLPLKILCQLPKIWNSVRKERKWLQKIAKEHSLDAVISDNRYGLQHPSVPSIFVTHQLQIKGHNKWLETFLLKLNYHYINSYNTCWVPDFEGKKNLAGALSHPRKLPLVPVKYLGTLSRFEPRESANRYDVLVVISGPEPQRTLFESIVLKHLENSSERVLIVRGLPGAADKPGNFNQVQIQNHLNAADMEQAFNESDFIISRAGYTTLMDVVKLKKKAILIPTPGQTEQEYLGRHLQEQSICLAFDQNKFNLHEALSKARSFDYQFPLFDMNAYKTVIDELLTSLRS